jgi:hypothetical protein
MPAVQFCEVGIKVLSFSADNQLIAQGVLLNVDSDRGCQDLSENY